MRQQFINTLDQGTECKIVAVGLDPLNQPCVWVELVPGDYLVFMPIQIVGTGRYIGQGKQHQGSFIQGPFVWHIYL